MCGNKADGSQGGCGGHGGGHSHGCGHKSLLWWLVALAIGVVVFSAGYKLGVLRGYLGWGYYSGNPMMYQGWGMMRGWQGGALPTPAATTSQK